MVTTTTYEDMAWDLSRRVSNYNDFRNVICPPSPSSQKEAERVNKVLDAGTDIIEPFRCLIRAVGWEDWGETSDAVDVRRSWLRGVVVLNEGVVLEENEEPMNNRYDEELSVEDLTTKARSVIRGNVARRKLEKLLEDAEIMDATDEELREALSYVVETGGCMRSMESFLLDERDDEGYPDDENAAVRLLAHTIFTPEFQKALQEHPEWKKFLL